LFCGTSTHFIGCSSGCRGRRNSGGERFGWIRDPDSDQAGTLRGQRVIGSEISGCAVSGEPDVEHGPHSRRNSTGAQPVADASE
jgi:hypothetical protein